MSKEQTWFPAHDGLDVSGREEGERAQARIHAIIGDVGVLTPLGRRLGVIEDSIINCMIERDEARRERDALRAALRFIVEHDLDASQMYDAAQAALDGKPVRQRSGQ